MDQSGSAKEPVAGTAPVPDAAAGEGPTVHPAVAAVGRWLRELADLPRDLTDAERIDLIRGLEELKGAAAAAQARASVDFDASQRAEQAAAGVRARDLGRGVAAQVALARRESPHRGGQHLGLAKVLETEMPHTRAALASGRISEWRATLLARETACLPKEHRLTVDRVLAGDRLAELERCSDRRLVAEAAKLAYRLDPHSVMERIRRAEKDRRVTSRPAPDTMSYLNALLPAAQGVATYAALAKAADTAKAAGDPRTRGQIMADTLVERLTGQAAATGSPVEIGLVVTDKALFANLGNHGHGDAGDHDDLEGCGDLGDEDDEEAEGSMGDDGQGDPREEPAYLRGYGIVPAAWVRNLVASLPADVKAWIRRLYTHPATGQLVAMDARRRRFTGRQREFTVLRDQICRTPWCDAPIRHTDHPKRHTDGGPTSALNSQGLCEACNYTKEALGWTARAVPGPAHTVRTTTPTGHSYDSTAPPQPGHRPPDDDAGPVDDPALGALLDHLVKKYAA